MIKTRIYNYLQVQVFLFKSANLMQLSQQYFYLEKKDSKF